MSQVTPPPHCALRQVGLPAQTIPDSIGQVRANREKSLFSHMWNFVREQGLTKASNPCAGVRGFREDGGMS